MESTRIKVLFIIPTVPALVVYFRLYFKQVISYSVIVDRLSLFKAKSYFNFSAKYCYKFAVFRCFVVFSNLNGMLQPKPLAVNSQ